MSLYFLLMLCVILICSFACSYWDLKTMKVSNWMIFSGCFMAICIHGIFIGIGVWQFLVTGLFCGVFYYVVRLITGNKLGMADVYFGIFQGLCLGWKLIPVCFAIQVAASALAMLILNRKRIPFIPFMSIGVIFTKLISVNF